MSKPLILIVDDLFDIRMTLAGMLSDFGYYCDVASSKQEAIKLLHDNFYKLAIIDIRLSEADEQNQDGLEIIDWLEATNSNTKAIVLTGYADIKVVTHAMNSSVVIEFIEKSEMDKLLEVINTTV